VKVLGADGRPLGRFGERGDGPGQFKLPHMLCVDSHGAVHVAEVGGKRVQKFVAHAPPVQQPALLTSGEGACHTYRIPALVGMAKGTLLAFCEGRKKAAAIAATSTCCCAAAPTAAGRGARRRSSGTTATTPAVAPAPSSIARPGPSGSS
jgi:hypothetical protein